MHSFWKDSTYLTANLWTYNGNTNCISGMYIFYILPLLTIYIGRKTHYSLCSKQHFHLFSSGFADNILHEIYSYNWSHIQTQLNCAQLSCAYLLVTKKWKVRDNVLAYVCVCTWACKCLCGGGGCFTCLLIK